MWILAGEVTVPKSQIASPQGGGAFISEKTPYLKVESKSQEFSVTERKHTRDCSNSFAGLRQR